MNTCSISSQLATVLITPDDKGWFTLRRDITPEYVSQLREVEHIPKLSVTNINIVTVRHIKQLIKLKSVERLWLWCDVMRRAMRHLIQLHGLTALDVLFIRGPGTMTSFAKAKHQKEFRANNSMSSHDLFCVSQCETLEVIGAQSSDLTCSALSALLELPKLRSLDIEATRFDDAMARRISRSTTITSLDIGGTRITGKGLSSLVKMQQLTSLDLWATKVTEDDLVALRELPQLEYVSLGNYDGLPSLDSKRVVSLLLELPSLKRVWLDGIRIEEPLRLALEAKLQSVQITT